ncbi:CHAT domain-containing protein [Chondrinema litorale]|uniref:CHAT domain-containing protein n=1 Tax=Chondrinema litorale TaxID=2994555 RepID=UPI0025429A3D|nr:CHAT domain-containing tetratricopeptide repeat protein [Chondrinema litorale]UZR98179.1 CHAT domain-containing protein [Chondrinema litorale]
MLRRKLTVVTIFSSVFLFYSYCIVAQNKNSIQLADSLIKEENYKEAAEILEHELKGSPSSEHQISLLNKLGNCYYSDGKYALAKTQLEKAFGLAKTHATPDLFASIQYDYGKALSRTSTYSEAEKQLKSALAFWKKNPEKCSEEISNCLDALGAMHMALHQLDKSEKYLLEALEIRQSKFGEDHLAVASIKVSLGNVYSLTGDYEKAEQNFLECLKIREVQLTTPHILLGSVNYNLGVLMSRTGRVAEANNYLYKALEIYTKLSPEHPRTGDAYLANGQLKVNLGDYKTAHNYFLKALNIFKNAYGEKQERVGTMYNLIANIYRLQGDYEQARNYAERGLEITKSVVGEKHDRVASGLTTLGDISADAKNYDTALNAYQQALRIRENIYGENHIRTAFIYYLIGQTYREADQPKAGIPYLKKAIQVYRNKNMEGTEDISNVYAAMGLVLLDDGDLANAKKYIQLDHQILKDTYGNTHPYLADNYRSMGLWYLKIQEPDSAIVMFHEGLKAMCLDFDTSDILAFPPLSNVLDQYEYLDIMIRKADVLASFNNPNYQLTALEYYQLCTKLAEQIRNKYQSKGSKLFFQQTVNPIFKQGFQLAYSLYKQTKKDVYLEAAYEFAEKSKAGLLTASIQKISEYPIAGIPKTLRNQIDSLQSKINATEQLVNDEQLWPSDNSGEQLKTLKKDQIDIQSSYDSLLLITKNQYPKYFEFNSETQIASISEIQQNLPNTKTTLIEYFISDSILYAFSITKDKVNISEHSWNANDEMAIKNLRQRPDAIPWLQNPSGLTIEYTQRSELLFKTLITEDILKAEKLIIIPHGILSYLPFESLCKNKVDDFKKANFLVETVMISYAYSATLWLSANNQTVNDNAQLLGIAPDYSEFQIASNEVSEELNFRGALSPLEFNVTELEKIANYFPANILNGTAATEENFKELAPQANILHMAMHALVSDSLPLESSLLFSYNSTSSKEDGKLHAYELYNMKLPASLAVLNACNTGFGKLQAGEGAMSLAHAFSYAGCNSIIMSLWPAEDKGSAAIIQYFYKHLADGQAKDKALQQAQIDFINTTDPTHLHPYYWTHLVAVGDMSPLNMKNRTLKLLSFILLSVPFGIYLYKIIKIKFD